MAAISANYVRMSHGEKSRPSCFATAAQIRPKTRPKSKQSQFSLNFINTSSRENVVRINEMIRDGKSFDQQTNSLSQFFTEIHRNRSGEFVFGYWGLKGYVPIDHFHMTSRPQYCCPKTIKRRPFWRFEPVL